MKEIDIVRPTYHSSGLYYGICLDTYVESPKEKSTLKLVPYNPFTLRPAGYKAVLGDKMVRVYKASPLEGMVKSD